MNREKIHRTDMDRQITLVHLRSDGFDYDVILQKIESEKRQAQISGQPDTANKLWGKWMVVAIHKKFTEVYKLLSVSEYYEAWCKAEEVEIDLRNLQRNDKNAYLAVKDLHTCITNLQSLYPYKIFFSHVMHIQKEECSICGKQRSVRNFCGHRKGYVYNGELCYNTVTKYDIKGVDIVFNPVHKYSVAFPVDENSNRQDKYDYTLLKGLMSYWKKPFQRWTYKIDTLHLSPTSFPDLKDSSSCPCGSGLAYSECCKKNPEGIKHKRYTFMMEGI